MPKSAGFCFAELMHELQWLAVVIVALGLTGCGGETSKRVPLSGKVTQADQPVKQGAISLVPAEGHRGVAANTSISDGVYKFTREDGPEPGPYKVTVMISFTKDELMQRRDEVPAPRTQWDFDIKVPESGSPSEDFRLDAK